jgi:putative spermidine/putrescine transport system ATP-binding protein
MAFLDIQHLEKSFGATRVVKDFNLSIEKGEFISLLGPSGCGKTTVLRMVAGFETPSAGVIRIGDQDVVNLRPNQRNIGMVFQSYALFPNLTVAQNVGFGLRVAGVAKPEIDTRVTEMLGLIGLPDLGSRYPFQLSGGQQQRVALARALAVRPRVLLLDEPLSALDAKIRVSLRSEIREIQKRLGITTIFVTHDQEEALSMSDRIVVMNGGIAEQVGAPFDIYNRPATKFVANFVGTLNTFDAEVSDPSTGRVRIGAVEAELGTSLTAARNSQIGLALRPEAVHLSQAPGRSLTLDARIVAVEFMGSVIRIKADVAGNDVSLDTFNRTDTPPPAVGDRVAIHINPKDFILLGA